MTRTTKRGIAGTVLLTVQALDTKAPVQLASLWSTRPVVLIFGSYT